MKETREDRSGKLQHLVWSESFAQSLGLAQTPVAMGNCEIVISDYYVNAWTIECSLGNFELILTGFSRITTTSGLDAT